MATATRQQGQQKAAEKAVEKAAESSRSGGRERVVSPWKNFPSPSGAAKNSVVVGTPVKVKEKLVQETAQAKMADNGTLVKAAYVLKPKNDESEYLFDPLRPTVSPIKRGETSGEEVSAVGNEESSQSSGVG